MYLETGVDSDGLTLYKSMRGSNKTESYHQKLIRMLGAYNMSVPLADAIISEFNFRYSVKAGVRHRHRFGPGTDHTSRDRDDGATYALVNASPHCEEGVGGHKTLI